MSIVVLGCRTTAQLDDNLAGPGTAAHRPFGEGFDTLWLQVISFIPFRSPLVLPGRMVRGWAEPWEVVAALAIMAVAIYGMLRLAGWIYTGGVARATQKLGWREAFRAGRELRSG